MHLIESARPKQLVGEVARVNRPWRDPQVVPGRGTTPVSGDEGGVARVRAASHDEDLTLVEERGPSKRQVIQPREDKAVGVDLAALDVRGPKDRNTVVNRGRWLPEAVSDLRHVLEALPSSRGGTEHERARSLRSISNGDTHRTPRPTHASGILIPCGSVATGLLKRDHRVAERQGLPD